MPEVWLRCCKPGEACVTVEMAGRSIRLQVLRQRAGERTQFAGASARSERAHRALLRHCRLVVVRGAFRHR